jgi:pimeloyl-ACP methyl ester carboxylesterase
LATAGLPIALAQPPTARGKSAPGKTARGKARGNANAPQRKGPPNAADPLARQVNDAAEKPAPRGTYHFRLKVESYDDATLAASYYPAKAETAAPVVLLVHEKDRSGKDFEDPVGELKGLGLAEHLQSLGYAVLAFDLRGYGANQRRPMTDRDWREMVNDLQAVYQFLVDRNNRGEVNLSRLGVVALGEGANLVALWAYLPGGAVSSEGRVTDLSGLVLVSPLTEGEGYPFATLMNALAPRIPVLLMAGERDAASHEAVRKVRANVEKTRQNKVELFPSSLHGYKLLRLEPRATSVLTKFLEGTVKLKSSEWEPRYNLAPVAFSDIQLIRHAKADADTEAEKAKEKEKAKGKEAPRGGAGDEKPKEKAAPARKAEAK